MDGRWNLFSRNYSTSDSSATKFLWDYISEERIGYDKEGLEHLYPIPFEVVNHLRRHTWSYVNKIGELKSILELLRRKASKKVHTYTEDSILVGNLKYLVNLSIQEIVQPLD